MRLYICDRCSVIVRELEDVYSRVGPDCDLDFCFECNEIVAKELRFIADKHNKAANKATRQWFKDNLIDRKKIQWMKSETNTNPTRKL